MASFQKLTVYDRHFCGKNRVYFLARAPGLSPFDSVGVITLPVFLCLSDPPVASLIKAPWALGF